MKTFLVADDSDMKREFLRVMVERSGIDANILLAKTTEAAMALIDKNDISYAFIDYEMPSKNGPTVIAYLRKKNPNAKIALVTSADSEKYKEDAFDAGADEFICTSLQSDEVEAKIRNTLQRWSGF